MGSAFFAGPKLPAGKGLALQLPEIQRHLPRLFGQVEQRRIPGTIFVLADPDGVRVVPDDLPRAEGVPVQPQHVPVGEQTKGGFVQTGQLRPENQRRTEDRPQGQQGLLFVRGEAGLPGLSELYADAAQRQHVAVRPAAGTDVALPDLAAGEHIFQQGPVVPEIVGDAPHIGVLTQVPRFFHGRGAGRKTQHDRASAAVDGPADHLDLMGRRVSAGFGLASIGNIVHLHKIHAPRSI